MVGHENLARGKSTSSAAFRWAVPTLLLASLLAFFAAGSFVSAATPSGAISVSFQRPKRKSGRPIASPSTEVAKSDADSTEGFKHAIDALGESESPPEAANQTLRPALGDDLNKDDEPQG